MTGTQLIEMPQLVQGVLRLAKIWQHLTFPLHLASREAVVKAFICLSANWTWKQDFARRHIRQIVASKIWSVPTCEMLLLAPSAKVAGHSNTSSNRPDKAKMKLCLRTTNKRIGTGLRRKPLVNIACPQCYTKTRIGTLSFKCTFSRRKERSPFQPAMQTISNINQIRLSG